MEQKFHGCYKRKFWNPENIAQLQNLRKYLYNLFEFHSQQKTHFSSTIVIIVISQKA